MALVKSFPLLLAVISPQYHHDPKFWIDMSLLPFCLHLLDTLLYGKTTLFKF